mmetsp:Transcript_12258/g.33065  ORF Transcript_12258/g.33065 Transcript_12258/m.33065 type:complete len:102 (-) Transcript_12258:510-815(-)
MLRIHDVNITCAREPLCELPFAAVGSEPVCGELRAQLLDGERIDRTADLCDMIGCFVGGSAALLAVEHVLGEALHQLRFEASRAFSMLAKSFAELNDGLER